MMTSYKNHFAIDDPPDLFVGFPCRVHWSIKQDQAAFPPLSQTLETENGLIALIPAVASKKNQRPLRYSVLLKARSHSALRLYHGQITSKSCFP